MSVLITPIESDGRPTSEIKLDVTQCPRPADSCSPLTSHIQAFEDVPPEGCKWYPGCGDHSMGFRVNDPGALHWKMLRIAKSGYPQVNADDFPVDESDLYAMRGFHIIDRGRGRDKTDEERFEEREAWEVTRAKCEAILKAGKAWSPLDPSEDTRIHSNGVKYNISNPLYKRIEYELRVHREDFDSRKELFAELGLEWETERKKELEDINMKKELPTTKLTKAQSEDIKVHNGHVAYVHVVLDKPRWYALDMGPLDTYAEAIERVKQKVKNEAWKKAGVPSRRTDRRTPNSHPELSRAFKEVVFRINEAFGRENIYILDWRSPITVAVAEQEWEANWGTVDHSRAITS